MWTGGTSCCRDSRQPASWATLTPAGGWLARLDTRDLTDRQRAVALQWIVACESTGSTAEHLALLDEALALLEGQPPSPELEKLLVHRVRFFMEVGRFDDARTELRRGLEVTGRARRRAGRDVAGPPSPSG